MRALFLGVFLSSLGLLPGAAVPFVSPTLTPYDPEGKPLREAAFHGNLNQVKVLLDQGVVLESADAEGATALFLASEKQADVVDYLIGKGARINVRALDGSTPLLNAAYGHNNRAVFSLLKAGANPNLGSKYDRYPLMYAANGGDLSLVDALLDAHADPDANSNEGPAVYWAAAKDHLEVLQKLVKAGANVHLAPKFSNNTPPPDRYVDTLLGLAAANGDIPMIDYLVGQGLDINEASITGYTPLMSAARLAEVLVIDKLLRDGAKIDAMTTSGETALMVAALSRRTEPVQALIDHHANLNLQDALGRTALIWAASKKQQASAQCLIDAGADLDLADKNGGTALIRAGMAGQVAMVDMLKARGARVTTVHIVPSNIPTPVAPTPEHAWALAVGAIYTQVDSLNWQILGGGRNRPDSREVLERGWKIKNRVDLVRELTELRQGGHHGIYASEGQKLAALSDVDFQAMLVQTPDKAVQLKATRAAYAKWGDRIGLAWDLCRSAMLVNQGYATGFFKEKEAWDQLMNIALEVQSNFASWQEMSDNFLDGREIWDDQRDPAFEAASRLLLDPQEALSPWNKNAWKTDLSAAVAN